MINLAKWNVHTHINPEMKRQQLIVISDAIQTHISILMAHVSQLVISPESVIRISQMSNIVEDLALIPTNSITQINNHA